MSTDFPMERRRTTRRLSAVWFADIVGFTSITSLNETLGLQHVDLLQRVCRREAEESYDGRIVKFIGDAALAEFSSADAAVRAAVAVNELYTEGARHLGRNSRLRIGIHLGEVIIAEDGDIYGDGVNVASRLQREAEPGRVLISEDVWRQLRQRPEFMFHSLGERELRGITARMGVFDVLVRGDGEAVDAPHPRFRESTSLLPKLMKAGGAAAVLGSVVFLAFYAQRPQAAVPAVHEPAQPVAQPQQSVEPAPVQLTADAEEEKPAKIVEEKPAVSPRETAVANTRRAIDNFARALSRGTAEDRYEFTRSVLREIHSFTGDLSDVTGVTVSGFTVHDYEPGRVQADLLLVVKQKSGTDIESIPLPFRATAIENGGSWQLIRFARR